MSQPTATHPILESLARNGDLEPVLEIIRERQMAAEKRLRQRFYALPLVDVPACADIHREQGAVDALGELLTVIKHQAGLAQRKEPGT